MLIAGGCYQESCESPKWQALLGSGGRAAAAIARLSPSVELFTYRPQNRLADLYPIEALGVRVHATGTKSEVAFAYFHPLSNPAIAPKTMPVEVPLHVEGGTVLRFGFMEGDAVVAADHAIYDPQRRRGAQSFAANGSRAETLAIVLNEGELAAATTVEDVRVAAQTLLHRDRATVVVAKGGIKGAQIFMASGECAWVPPYRSHRVFKIGSGDVFSAAFAHYWGEAHLDAVTAADLASRSVASYCGSRRLPLPPADQLHELVAIESPPSSLVCVHGSVATLGSRWVLEEARWCLQELGVSVVAPVLDDESLEALERGNYQTLLVFSDGINNKTVFASVAAARSDVPTVILNETNSVDQELAKRSNLRITDDFATAIYFAAWAAASAAPSP